jgi:hypothetical protein
MSTVSTYYTYTVHIYTYRLYTLIMRHILQVRDNYSILKYKFHKYYPVLTALVIVLYPRSNTERRNTLI